MVTATVSLHHPLSIVGRVRRIFLHPVFFLSGTRMSLCGLKTAGVTKLSGVIDIWF